jgi:hypothetical protein
MTLAAGAIVRRLDPAQEYRPWFLQRGQGGIPATPEHASWDLGDMTGRYLEELILTRRMGVSRRPLPSPLERQHRDRPRAQGHQSAALHPSSRTPRKQRAFVPATVSKMNAAWIAHS